MNPTVLTDFYRHYETGLGALVSNPLPWLTARRPWKAREKIAAAILNYHHNGGVEQASELIKLRHALYLGAGLSPEEYALLEVPMPTGFLSNTVPAAFWTLYEIYSRPELLQDLRQEMELNALSTRSDGTRVIDIGALRGNCPLLLSAFQEILRVRTMSTPTRVVTQDTLIADRYLVKAGSLVTMPSVVMGKRSEVWGETATVFDARRFMKGMVSESRLGEREPRRLGGFMAFGVSPTICPGRHFASSEILAMVAIMILRYDIAPMGGIWEEPEKFLAPLVSIMTPVKGEVPVTVKPREKYEGTKWDFHVEEGKGQFPLVIG
jgi:cytochrome P450